MTIRKVSIEFESGGFSDDSDDTYEYPSWTVEADRNYGSALRVRMDIEAESYQQFFQALDTIKKQSEIEFLFLEDTGDKAEIEGSGKNS